MKTFGAVTFADFRQSGAKPFVSWQAGEERLTQSSQVKSGAAHQESSATAAFDIFNLCDRRARPVSGSEIDLR